jgi:uncharacterized protein YfkK (UPF0435 family)
MSDQLCQCCQVGVVEPEDREDARSDNSGLSYIDALIASSEEHPQEIRVITDKLVELNPGE